jgi:hypothetical protein
MNLPEKIDPYLTSDDKVVRQFALNAVGTFPSIKPEWPARLLKEVIEKPEKASDYATALGNMTFSNEDVLLLMEAMKSAPGFTGLSLRRVAEGLPLDVKIENREVLQSVFSMEEWGFFTQVAEASQDGLEQMLENHLKEMESLEHYDQRPYNRAKAMAYRQAKEGWVDQEDLHHTIQEQKSQPYFDFKGMIAVYKAGLIKDESMIEELASLLLRDEDILLEELRDTLIQFQSDRVVGAVEPLAAGPTPIYQIDVIGETHTEGAIEALKRLYWTIEDTDMKSVAIRGLAEQLSAEGRPEIEDYMTYEYKGQIFDMDEMAYGYFKVMGYDHPELEDWRSSALRKLERYDQILSSELEAFIPPTRTPVTSTKVGRNEPCPCGSGKKYKKCHGK